MNSLSFSLCVSLSFFLSLYLCASIVCISTHKCMYACVEVRGQILGPVSYPPPYFEGIQSSPTTTSSRLATCKLPGSTLHIIYKSLKNIYSIFLFFILQYDYISFLFPILPQNSPRTQLCTL